MDAIDNLLTRGVDKIYPSREALEKVLQSGKKLRLYQGVDPSGAKIHIGHAVGLRKLKQFQDLGHQVILLIGDFTGMIGDPTGKSETRKKLTREEVLKNAKDYKEQAAKVLRFDGDNPVEIKFNSTWLARLTFADVLELVSTFSVQQMIERDMFQKRLKEGKEISLVEFLYPVMVAYDAVAMEVDLELGGRDQTFNMLAGRKLHEQRLHKEKFVMTVPLLADSKGIKIGKSEGNAIGITDPPSDLYGKIMSLGDDAIIPCFTLLTDFSIEEIENMKKKMEKGENPMEFKRNLAFELTKQFNSEQKALEAEAQFEQVHQQGKLPYKDVPIFATKIKDWNPIDLLSYTKLASSKSEAKRFIEQRAVEYNQLIISNKQSTISLSDGDIIKVGKRKFLKIHLL